MTVRISRTIIAAAIVACIAATVPTLSSAATASSTSANAKAATAQSGINAMRARVGRGPLRTSASLSRSASSYARTMLRRHYFGHASRIRASHRFKALGETLALQPGGARPRTVVRMWHNSPGHYAVLTGGQFRQIGIGFATGRFHGRRVTLWVAQLGRK